jgi:hypothetical protein
VLVFLKLGDGGQAQTVARLDAANTRLDAANTRLDAANTRLEHENAELRERNRVVEERLARLESVVEMLAQRSPGLSRDRLALKALPSKFR